MAKHTLSLHLSDTRKNRLDALISHSEYEGHGAQSEYLRSLIDQAAADHPDINYDDPQKAIETDEWEYDPLDYDGLLDQQQVREILNSEKAPAINPEHCPPTWEPRNKSDKAVLMAAHYRYHHFLDNSRKSEARNTAIEDVVGMVPSEKKSDYRDRLSQVLDTYGETPSNLITVEGVPVRGWLDRMGMLVEKNEISNKTLTQHIQKGEKMRQKVHSVNQGELVEDIEQIINELQRRKQES
jgi:hypothetical protein